MPSNHGSATGIPVLIVDAFTSEPFRGNPAGVVLLREPREESWMQSVAAELKHAETAFLVPEDGGFHLRWFTPVSEVDLCGHATLASAHALWESGRIPRTEAVHFRTKSGTLSARSVGTGIELDFPAMPAGRLGPKELPPDLLPGLGATPRFVGWNGMDYLLELESEEQVRTLAPDVRRLAPIGTRGFIVTAAGHAGFDFVSRFFAPAFGIDEDPVTGSAHCCLGPYWAGKLSKDELVGYQASPRGGTVRVVVRGDRVGLIGQAVTVIRGTFAE